MRQLFYILTIGLVLSCAPSGIEEDLNDFLTDSIFYGEENKYIDTAFIIAKLDKDEVGNYQLANQYIDSAININPKSSKAFRIKAYITLLQGDSINALTIINKSISSDSLDLNSYLTRANIYIRLNKREKALEDYYKVLEFDSLNGRIWEAIGYMEFDKGNETKGCEYLNKARELGYLVGRRYSDSILCN